MIAGWQKLLKDQHLLAVVEALIDLRDVRAGSTFSEISNQYEANMEMQGKDISPRYTFGLKKAIKRGMDMGILYKQSTGNFKLKFPQQKPKKQSYFCDCSHEFQNTRYDLFFYYVRNNGSRLNYLFICILALEMILWTIKNAIKVEEQIMPNPDLGIEKNRQRWLKIEERK